MSEYLSSASGSSPILYLAMFAVLVVVFVLYLREASRRRSLASDVARVGGEAAHILDKPSLAFTAIPSELLRVRENAAQLRADFGKLERESASLSAIGDTELHAAAALRALTVTRGGLVAMANHRDGAALAKVLDLPGSLGALEATFAEVAAAADREERLVQGLLGGKLNMLFTADPLIEAYFEDEESLAPVRLGLACARAAAEIILFRGGLRVRIVRPLTRLPADAPGAHPLDTRNIRNVESIRTRVRRIARTLGRGESLIVDCHTPGWISRSHGDVPPRFAVYDASAWA